MTKRSLSCELCMDKGFNLNALLDHYAVKHDIAKTNPILIKYLASLLSPNTARISRCLICEEITDGDRQKSAHELRMHTKLCSDEIDSVPVNRNVDLVGAEVNKLLYTISIYRSDHYYDYDWNSPSMVDAFLSSSKLVIDSLRIKEITPSKKITVIVTFSIVNKDARSRVTKYMPVRSWSTTPLKTLSLNTAVMESFKCSN